MRGKRTCGVLVCLAVSGAASAVAQGNPLDAPAMREMLHKFWNPVVGSGEVYQSSVQNGEHWRTIELTVVGKETVEGQQGYWVEMAMDMPQMGGTVYAKDLLVPSEEAPRRGVVQLPGEAAMELPMNGHPGARKPDKTQAHKVGAETVTVPAGTFACEHWKDKDADVWVTSKVSPITVVKTVSKDKDDVVLVKLISGAKDHITGPVKPFDPSVFMRHMKRPGDGS
jgi:hypothetical protein